MFLIRTTKTYAHFGRGLSHLYIVTSMLPYVVTGKSCFLSCQYPQLLKLLLLTQIILDKRNKNENVVEQTSLLRSSSFGTKGVKLLGLDAKDVVLKPYVL